MKIFRFDLGQDVSRETVCFQNTLVRTCCPPELDEEICAWLEEIQTLSRSERKRWVFGFTKEQFVRACRFVKSQGRFCQNKDHLVWKKGLKISVYEVDSPVVFDDQVLFRKGEKR